MLTIFRLIALRLKKVLGQFLENGINFTVDVNYRNQTRVSKPRRQVSNKFA